MAVIRLVALLDLERLITQTSYYRFGSAAGFSSTGASDRNQPSSANHFSTKQTFKTKRYRRSGTSRNNP